MKPFWQINKKTLSISVMHDPQTGEQKIFAFHLQRYEQTDGLTDGQTKS